MGYGVANQQHFDFVQPFVQYQRNLGQKKTPKTSKLCITVPLWGESTGHRWIPLTKGQ